MTNATAIDEDGNPCDNTNGEPVRCSSIYLSGNFQRLIYGSDSDSPCSGYQHRVHSYLVSTKVAVFALFVPLMSLFTFVCIVIVFDPFGLTGARLSSRQAASDERITQTT